LQNNIAQRKGVPLTDMSHKSVSNLGAAFGMLAVGSMIGWFGPGASSTPGISGEAAYAEPKANAEMVSNASPREAEGDFSGRLAKVLEIRNGLKSARAIGAIADGLDPQEIHEALKAVEKMHIRERPAIVSSLLSRWVEIEPEGAFDYAVQTEPELDCIGEVIASWVKQDEAAARAAIGKLPEGENRNRRAALAGLVEALGDVDPARAFAELQKNNSFSYPIESVFEKWASKDLQTAALHAVNLTERSMRRDALRAIAKAWANADLHAALQWAETLPEGDVAGYTGTSSPLAVVVGDWMDRDPEGALRFLEERPVDSRTQETLTALSLEAIFKIDDPLISARILSILPRDEKQNTAWQNLASWWGRNDLAGALAWAKSQANDVQQAVMPALATELAASDPAAALKLVSDRSARDINGVINTWAYRDPASAAEWLATQPPNAEHLQTVAYAWVQKDVAKATEWINAIDNGTEKDKAIGYVVDHIQVTHPEVASAWIAGIHDEKKRTEAYGSLASVWFVFDPAAARKWLSTAPVPDDMRSRIMKAEGQ
jgi:hypothetical protein